MPPPLLSPHRWERTISQRSAHHAGSATVHLYDDLLKGKSVAINVMYTSCKDECPLETGAARPGAAAARREDGKGHFLLLDHHRP